MVSGRHERRGNRRIRYAKRVGPRAGRKAVNDELIPALPARLVNRGNIVARAQHPECTGITFASSFDCGLRHGFRCRPAGTIVNRGNLGEGLAADTGVRPTIARNAARGSNALRPAISPRVIAGAIAFVLATIAGCSNNTHNLGTAPLRRVAAADPWAAFSSNPRVGQILAGACFDCHSEQGTAAWYVRMAPSYWFSDSAREDLNFTDWKDYDAHR